MMRKPAITTMATRNAMLIPKWVLVYRVWKQYRLMGR